MHHDKLYVAQPGTAAPGRLLSVWPHASMCILVYLQFVSEQFRGMNMIVECIHF